MKTLPSFAGKKRLRPLLFLFDSVWIALAAILAEIIRTAGVRNSLTPDSLSALILPVVVCIALWTITARRLSLDHLQDFSQLSAFVSRVTIGVMLLVPMAMGVAFMARNMYSRLFFMYLGLLLLLGFTVIRVALRKVILRFRSHFAVRTVIIGSGRIAQELAGKISSCPELMRDLVAFVHPANSESPDFALARPAQSVKALSSVKILELLNESSVAEVILAGVESGAADANQLVWQCRQHGIEVCVIPHSYNLYSSHARILDFGGLPLVKVESRVPQIWELRFKRLLDIVLAIPLIPIALPISLLIAVRLAFRGRHPLHSESRCGYNGREFLMYRFNLPRHADNLGAVDAMLDRLSLTELPQLWNVLRGDMSLVGPRPEDPARVRNYSEWQRQRLAMQPGITGLAQVQGLRDKHSSDEKSRYDLQYIHNWSPLVDLSLIVQTVWTLCFRIKQSHSNRRYSAMKKKPKPQVPGTAGVSLGEADVNRAQSGAD